MVWDNFVVHGSTYLAALDKVELVCLFFFPPIVHVRLSILFRLVDVS